MKVSGARLPKAIEHVRLAVLHAERVRAIVIGELRAFAEVTNHGGFRDRLGHLDVQRVRPLRVLDVVTLRAGGGSQILAVNLRRKVLGLGTWGLGLLVGADGQRQQQEQERRAYQARTAGHQVDIIHLRSRAFLELRWIARMSLSRAQK